jgi:hypothetical protein
MLGQTLQAFLSCMGPAFQLPQVLGQLLKVHLERQVVYVLSSHI